MVDAGCGEGYYTARLVQALRASGKTPSAAAFDISKFAVKAAARRDKAHAVQWAVASSFAIPVADAAADCLVDIFSPAAAQEFARVVKPGGAFVFAVPGPRHLYGLKEVLYERPYENTVQDVAYPGFALEQRIPVHSMLTVTGSTILDLFAMTPYYWKTPRSGAERLASLRIRLQQNCILIFWSTAGRMCETAAGTEQIKGLRYRGLPEIFCIY